MQNLCIVLNSYWISMMQRKIVTKIYVNKFYCFIQLSKTICLACLPKQEGANHSYLWQKLFYQMYLKRYIFYIIFAVIYILGSIFGRTLYTLYYCVFTMKLSILQLLPWFIESISILYSDLYFTWKLL